MLYLKSPRRASHHTVLEKIQNTATLIYPRQSHVRRARMLKRAHRMEQQVWAGIPSRASSLQSFDILCSSVIIQNKQNPNKHKQTKIHL